MILRLDNVKIEHEQRLVYNTDLVNKLDSWGEKFLFTFMYE